jgi:uncharacterized protein
MLVEAAVEPGRLRTLRRGGKVLVMDRVTGRSTFVPLDREPFLHLIAWEEEQLPADLAGLRRQVVGELAAQGVGTLEEPRFESLNTLILKLTKACNFTCTYCYEYESEDKAVHLDVDWARSAVRQSLELCDGWLQLIFHGGEPFFMFDRIKEIVLYGEAQAALLDKQIFFTGQTNLSRLSDDTIRFSVEHDIHWGFSLDGPPQHNDRFRIMRNGSGTHRYFEEALARYPEFVRGCSALVTVTSANQDDLLGISRYLQACGLSGWDWSLFHPIGRGRRHEEMEFDVGRLIASWNELFDAVVAGEFEGFAVDPVLDYVNNFVQGPGRNMCMRQNCGAARDLLSISSDGQIEACDCLDKLGPFANLGHVGETSLAAARDCETAQTIRSRDTRQSRCDDCIWLAVCGGSCLAYAPGLHGVYETGCQLALNAFDRISSQLAASDRLLAYRRSCYGPTGAGAR